MAYKQVGMSGINPGGFGTLGNIGVFIGRSYRLDQYNMHVYIKPLDYLETSLGIDGESLCVFEEQGRDSVW